MSTDAEMIGDPGSWPLRPCLPLKRKTGEGPKHGVLIDPECGPFLGGEKSATLTVWFINVFDMRYFSDGTLGREYPTVEALLAEWGVD